MWNKCSINQPFWEGIYMLVLICQTGSWRAFSKLMQKQTSEGNLEDWTNIPHSSALIYSAWGEGRALVAFHSAEMTEGVLCAFKCCGILKQTNKSGCLKIPGQSRRPGPALRQIWEPAKGKCISTIPQSIQWSIPILEPSLCAKSRNLWRTKQNKTKKDWFQVTKLSCRFFFRFFNGNSPLKSKSMK